MTESAFQHWWNTHYFHTDNINYQVCRRLNRSNVDLDYVAALSRLLIIIDSSAEAFPKFVGNRTPLIEAPVQYRPGTPEWFIKLADERFSKLKNELQEIYADKAYFQKFGIKKEKRWWIKEAQYLRAEAKRLGVGTPIAKLLNTYEPFDSNPKAGHPKDGRGSLFLLAAAEHFQKTQVSSRYLLAAMLLKLIRGERRKSDHLERTAATVRVDNLKRTHKHWKSDLKILRAHLYAYVRSNFEAVEIVSSAPELFSDYTRVRIEKIQDKLPRLAILFAFMDAKLADTSSPPISK